MPLHSFTSFQKGFGGRRLRQERPYNFRFLSFSFYLFFSILGQTNYSSIAYRGVFIFGHFTAVNQKSFQGLGLSIKQKVVLSLATLLFLSISGDLVS